MGLIAGIPAYQAWAERSQRAFPKVAFPTVRRALSFISSTLFNVLLLHRYFESKP